jgi:hypothetical protein
VIICVACHQQKKLSAENNPLLLSMHNTMGGIKGRTGARKNPFRLMMTGLPDNHIFRLFLTGSSYLSLKIFKFSKNINNV